jgi:hypothetical protein
MVIISHKIPGYASPFLLAIIAHSLAKGKLFPKVEKFSSPQGCAAEGALPLHRKNPLDKRGLLPWNGLAWHFAW